MSTDELLKHVKKLSPRQREKFLQSVMALQEKPKKKPPAKKVKPNWPDIEARARRICGNRVLPNLVLLEREEYTT